MTERYSFFREEDERTLAVLGEDAAASDLEGTYQKPYAVLTQKRLYCKNEQGNFIADAGRVTLSKQVKTGRPWILSAAAALLAVILLILLIMVPTGRMPMLVELLSFRLYTANKAIGQLEALSDQLSELEESGLPLSEADSALLSLSADEIRQIYQDCSLSNFPTDRTSAQLLLENAQDFAAPEDSESTAPEQFKEQLLSQLAGKFAYVYDLGDYVGLNSELGGILQIAGLLPYCYFDESFDILNVTPENMELFTRYCESFGSLDDIIGTFGSLMSQDRLPFPDLPSYASAVSEGSFPGDQPLAERWISGSISAEEEIRFHAQYGLYYLLEGREEYDLNALTPEQQALYDRLLLESELSFNLFNVEDHSYFCHMFSNTLLRDFDWQRHGGSHWDYFFGRLVWSMDFPDAFPDTLPATTLAYLYFVASNSTSDPGTPAEFLTMLDLFIQLGLNPEDVVPQAPEDDQSAIGTGSLDGLEDITPAAWEKIAQYSAEERSGILLPLCLVGEDRLTQFIDGLEIQARLTQLKEEMNPAVRDSVNYLLFLFNAHFSDIVILGLTLCAWFALLGCVGTLLLLLLNNARLAAIVGAAAGVLCAVCTIAGIPLLSQLHTLPPPLLIPGMLCLGGGAAVICMVVLIGMLKRQVAPRLYLTTPVGTFSFLASDYPPQERETFTAALKRK